ncbi:MAG: hypothetical protein VXV96_14530 [Bdellovibrionota bacterium]|jgi:tetratricopeptide (TPR) repeat protein|nr:hypothetical protein [Bdellovibrionota bacterium]
MKNNLFILIVGVLITSCDFTPPLNKEIIDAQQAIIQQKYDSAISKYLSILEKNPPLDIQVKINYQIGDLYSIYLSQNTKALPYYERIMKISEDPLWLVKTQDRLGEIHFTYLKNYKLSASIYEKLSLFQPKLAKQDFYQFRYALSTLKTGDYKNSLVLFKIIEDTKESSYTTRSLYFQGLIHFQQKNWKQAVAIWKKYLMREKRRDNIVQTKFLMANAYETMEKLKAAYNIYYSILGEYPNTEVIKNRLKSIYERRVARKR